MEQNKPKNIWSKLMEIQKEFKTFAVSEDSDKTDTKGKPAYKYTPGWEIVERLRVKMDTLSLMLVQNVTRSASQMIEYPVYKLISGQPMTFFKREMYVELTVEFTWIDTATGEQAGPFTTTASGANGTDKSMASALALAERYFLLKFFRITTHEKGDEPDAHDCDSVPGIPKEVQQGSSPYRPVAPSAPQPQEQTPTAAYRQGPSVGAAAPAQGVPDYANMAPPTYGQRTASQPATAFDVNNPQVAAAVTRLVFYDKGTPTHQQILNETLASLSAQGINIFTPNFIDNIVETAQARRENRAPILK